MNDNIILLADGYKYSHYNQLPPKTTFVYSYFSARSNHKLHPNMNKVLFFGLQYIMKRYLEGQVITREKIDNAKQIINKYYNRDVFNLEGWEYILNVHNGKLPIEIKALEESSLVDIGIPLFVVYNTDEKSAWLTSFIETLLVQSWYPTTVATYSYYCRELIKKYMEETCENLDGLDYKLHDFGMRGVSSMESAAIGGAAHSLNFAGSDTTNVIEFINEYYRFSNSETSIQITTIPAMEHSTVTTWKNESEAYLNMLKQYPKGTIACVSDSYDIFNACENIWGKELKNKVENRNGCVVIRPDSGDPVETVLKVLNILGDKFGYKINSKGFKVLNDKIRIIQGDGINYISLGKIMDHMKLSCWSIDNIFFGMGGALLQNHTRDDFSFALKCSYMEIDGVGHPVSKNPVGDPGKKSKSGKFVVVKNDWGYSVFSAENTKIYDFNCLKPVFWNGKIIKSIEIDN
jgi:nicotinamide phosphoribosyltransferase